MDSAWDLPSDANVTVRGVPPFPFGGSSIRLVSENDVDATGTPYHSVAVVFTNPDRESRDTVVTALVFYYVHPKYSHSSRKLYIMQSVSDMERDYAALMNMMRDVPEYQTRSLDGVVMEWIRQVAIALDAIVIMIDKDKADDKKHFKALSTFMESGGSVNAARRCFEDTLNRILPLVTPEVKAGIKKSLGGVNKALDLIGPLATAEQKNDPNSDYVPMIERVRDYGFPGAWNLIEKDVDGKTHPELASGPSDPRLFYINMAHPEDMLTLNAPFCDLAVV